MKKIIIDNRVILTNFDNTSRCNYSIDNNPSSKYNYIQKPFNQTEEDFFNYLVNKGYSRIIFKRATTCVRGYYHIYALCK